MTESFTSLPIFPFLDEIASLFSQEGLLLLSAEPGAGKTTLVPWKLLSHPAFAKNKILLLEPRRLAARAAADRIAGLLGEKAGQTVGLRTRLETLVSERTRLEVVTEGVLTRIIQEDPALEGYGTILFDEFHTRSLQGDLGLALAWDVRKILRPDLRLGLLSATLPVEAIRSVFGSLPLVEVPGRIFPVEILYRPALSLYEKPWEAAARLGKEALAAVTSSGPATVLCFLPGYREMHRAQEILQGQIPDVAVLLLHGQMPPEKQREILDPDRASVRRVILATNVAETSLTIPGVRGVVDIGLERRVRFSARTGMDHWETVAISAASAEQRKGRAGRTGPGVCYRWWRPDAFREPFSPPEISEADLAPLVLETSLWGASSPQDLAWLTPPPEASVRQATGLLQNLQLLDTTGKITNSGRIAARLPVHPRLAKMVLDSGQENRLDTAAVAAALLENDDLLSGADPDFRDRLAAFRQWAGRESSKVPAAAARQIWNDARRILRAQGKRVNAPEELAIEPEMAGEILLSAYPDRAAKRTRLDDRITSRWLLASGRGALMKGPLSQEEFLVAPDLDGGETDARIFLAAPIERKDLEQGKAGPAMEHWILEWIGWKPKSRVELKVGALVLKEKRAGTPPLDTLQAEACNRLQALGLSGLPWNPSSRRFLGRCRFVEKWGRQPDWPVFGDDVLLQKAYLWLLPFGKWDGGPVWDEPTLFAALEQYLGWNRRTRLDDLAPESLTLPSGSVKKLDYETNDIPVVSARLQEFFGCVTTPKICGQPLLLDLLSPAGRTVQRTRDLDGFWDRAYPEVKKDLMGRYPRHYWPDNPREAEPTRRVKPRK